MWCEGMTIIASPVPAGNSSELGESVGASSAAGAQSNACEVMHRGAAPSPAAWLPVESSGNIMVSGKSSLKRVWRKGSVSSTSPGQSTRQTPLAGQLTVGDAPVPHTRVIKLHIYSLAVPERISELGGLPVEIIASACEAGEPPGAVRKVRCNVKCRSCEASYQQGGAGGSIGGLQSQANSLAAIAERHGARGTRGEASSRPCCCALGWSLSDAGRIQPRDCRDH